MSVPTTTLRPPVGQRTELARYRISAGERILYGQRVRGVVRVVDAPVGRGRAYLVERELEQDGLAALEAMIADYVAQSERRDEPAIVVNLEQLASKL
jgi:hypothetical protein